MKSEKIIGNYRKIKIKIYIEILKTPPFPFNLLISYY